MRQLKNFHIYLTQVKTNANKVHVKTEPSANDNNRGANLLDGNVMLCCYHALIKISW